MSVDATDGFLDVQVASGTTIRAAAVESMKSMPLVGDAGGPGDQTCRMIWQGAYALCSLALTGAFDGRGVIELGIGSALTTAVIAQRAAFVLGLDCAPAALEAAALTMEANGVADRVILADYDWRQPVARVLAHLPAADPPGKEVVGWSVCASEIVYPSTTADSVRALFETTRELALALGARSVAGGGAATGGAGTTGALSATPSPVPFIISYTQRRASTTLHMLAAAWRAGWRWVVLPFATADDAHRAKGSYLLQFTALPPATHSDHDDGRADDAGAAAVAAGDASTAAAPPAPASSSSSSPGLDAVAAAAAMPPAFRDLVAATHPRLLAVELPQQARDEQWALDEAAAFTWPGAGLPEEEDA